MGVQVVLKVWWDLPLSPGFTWFLASTLWSYQLYFPPGRWKHSGMLKEGTCSSRKIFSKPVYLKKGQLADFNLITVLKTVHWKPVTDNYLKFKPRFLYKIFYLLSWVLFSVCHYTERNIRFIGPGKRKFGFLIWHLTDSKKALVLIHTSGIS